MAKSYSADENILSGKPTIKGTRISVELILELLSAGWSEAMIFESYPNITDKDLQAVFSYLKDGLENDLYLSLSDES